MLVESIEECEVVIFPAWPQVLPVAKRQKATNSQPSYSIGSDHSALRPSFFCRRASCAATPPCVVFFANKGYYRRVLTGSAPPIILH